MNGDSLHSDCVSEQHHTETAQRQLGASAARIRFMRDHHNRNTTGEEIMVGNFDQIYESVRNWAEAHSIPVTKSQLPAGKAGEFDGLSIIMNSAFGPEERVYYLTHAIGSIVCWSLDGNSVQEMFDELRHAKEKPESTQADLDLAIDRYRNFETESSRFAVWLLGELGQDSVVARYTNFMRADIESMTEFHRNGRAPVWRVFFARWNDEVAYGKRDIAPFQPRPIPPVRRVRIERQEILQQQVECF
jgi:hypothetical protein